MGASSTGNTWPEREWGSLPQEIRGQSVNGGLIHRKYVARA